MKPATGPSADANQSRPLDNDQAFSAFFDRTHLAVFRFIYGLHGGPREEVEDLAAEAYARAWRSRRRFVGSRRDELRWIFRIARNLVIDTFRRNKSSAPPYNLGNIEPADPSGGPEEQTASADQNERLLLALQQVSDHEREILVLRYLLEWRVKDIAAHLMIAENTISVQLRRALEKMRLAWPPD